MHEDAYIYGYMLKTATDTNVSKGADAVERDRGIASLPARGMMKIPYVSDFAQAAANIGGNAVDAVNTYRGEDPRAKWKGLEAMRKMDPATKGFMTTHALQDSFQPGSDSTGVMGQARVQEAAKGAAGRAFKDPNARKAIGGYIKDNYGKQIAGAGALAAGGIGLAAMMMRRRKPAQAAMSQAFNARKEPWAMRLNE